MTDTTLKFHRVRIVGRNLDDLRALLGNFPIEIIPDEDTATVADLVISHGGDGSLLGAEARFPGIPKFALRDRKNNPKCPLHDEHRQLEELFARHCAPCKLAKLIATRNATGETLTGINDVVISREIPSSAIRCRILENSRLLCPQVISDGIVFCTPFGSTGYFQSITRGNFQQGLGIAYNNPMDGNAFTILSEDTRLEVEILRGPALAVTDNNPKIVRLDEGEKMTIHFASKRTTLYGLEALRCPECYHLRANGIKH